MQKQTLVPAPTRKQTPALTKKQALVPILEILNVEAMIQEEKLQAVIELESEINELKEIYKEFHYLIEDQQKGLDIIENNIDKSSKFVQTGTNILKKINK